jgi:predicted unusual protein kinase regulating ubiquinone biosynthesis (AarF/ABC1/UbiB family)
MTERSDRGERRSARVPQTRTERVGRLGAMLAGIAGDAAIEALRRAAGGGSDGNLVLTESSARRLADTLAELRGAAMKLGQLLSLQGDDLLPPEIAALLGTLRSQARYMPRRQLHGVLAEELGGDWRERFANFDEDALAAASIGQVHAAQTVDGRDLALKVQYPGVAESIPGDVDGLGVVLKLSRVLPDSVDVDGLLADLKRELALEADYVREAASSERYRALVADDPGVFVPRVHADLSTRRVLACDRVYALPIDDLRSPEHTQERRDALGSQLLRLVFRELFVFRFMQTDPNFANYLYDAKHGRVALLDFGASREFAEHFTEAYRRLIVASVEGERSDVLEQGRLAGFLNGDETPGARTAFETLCDLVAEPLRPGAPYDFAGSDLSRRVRDHGMGIMTRERMPHPPTESLFLHRKLAGSFLLCAHIGASVDGNALYRELVA